MVKPFVLAGKASQVFKIIELAAKREQARELLEKTLAGKPCPFRHGESSCNLPPCTSCEYLNCTVWKETFKDDRK